MEYNLFIQIFLLFSFFQSFAKLKLVFVLSLNFFFSYFQSSYEKLQKFTYRSHTNSPTLTRTTVRFRCPLTREREGYVVFGGMGDGGTWGGWGMGVRDGGYVGDGGTWKGYVVGCVGGTYGGYVGEGGWIRWAGGGVVVDVRSWSKMLFLGTFWKITTYWRPLVQRVRSSFA